MKAQNSPASVRETQIERDSALAIHLEPIAAIYPEQNGTYVLSRIAKFRLSLGQQFAAHGAEVSLTFSALNKELYGTFPLHLYVHVNGLCTEIVALEEEFGRVTTRFRVKRPGIVHVGVQLRNRVLPPENGDLRLPAIKLTEVTAERLAKNATPLAVPYVDGSKSQYAQAKFFNVDAPSADPIFIIGSPRSGTSILTWAIGAHPNIYPIEETNFFPLLALSAAANYRHASRASKSFIKWFDVDRSTFMRHHGMMMHDLIMNVTVAQHRFNAHKHLAGVSFSEGVAFTLARSAEDSKKRWVDGAPINTSVSYLLSMMYPNAKFIHLVRHPASVIASLMQFANAGGDGLTYKAAINEWSHQVRYGRLLEAALGPDRVLALRLEELSEASDEQMRKVFQFLGEPHYGAVIDRFRVRINSSNVDLQFYDEIRLKLHADDCWQQLQALHEATTGYDNSAAITELEDLFNDIGVSLVKVAFGYQLDSIF
jgi:hypothetical protein